jgi:anthrone oxygenase-like protein
MSYTERMALEATAVFASGLFAGVAVYVALIARASWLRAMRSNVSVALADFRFVFPRVMALQSLFVVVGTACSIGWWASSGTTGFLVGGCLLGAVAPFTVLFVTPVYRQLLDPGTKDRPREAERQLVRWAWLHLARAALGLGAFGVLVACLVR